MEKNLSIFYISRIDTSYTDVIIRVKVQDIRIEGDHTASICLENAADLHESGNNNFDAEVRFD